MMKKKKGYAKGGMKKKKGYAKGGATKKKAPAMRKPKAKAKARRR
jgi:hypothetical protein